MAKFPKNFETTEVFNGGLPAFAFGSYGGQAANAADGKKLPGTRVRFPGRVRERDTNYTNGHESLNT
jgi:hypothetical protein